MASDFIRFSRIGNKYGKQHTFSDFSHREERVYEYMDHQSRLQKRLYLQWVSRINCDLIIQSDGCNLPVHSCVIACFSTKVSGHVSNSGTRSSSPETMAVNFEPDSVIEVVTFMYTGSLRLKRNTAKEMLKCAQWFGVTAAVKCIQEFINDLASIKAKQTEQLVKSVQRYLNSRAHAATGTVNSTGGRMHKMVNPTAFQEPVNIASISPHRQTGNQNRRPKVFVISKQALTNSRKALLSPRHKAIAASQKQISSNSPRYKAIATSPMQFPFRSPRHKAVATSPMYFPFKSPRYQLITSSPIHIPVRSPRYQGIASSPAQTPFSSPIRVQDVRKAGMSEFSFDPSMAANELMDGLDNFMAEETVETETEITTGEVTVRAGGEQAGPSVQQVILSERSDTILFNSLVHATTGAVHSTGGSMHRGVGSANRWPQSAGNSSQQVSFINQADGTAVLTSDKQGHAQTSFVKVPLSYLPVQIILTSTEDELDQDVLMTTENSDVETVELSVVEGLPGTYFTQEGISQHIQLISSVDGSAQDVTLTADGVNPLVHAASSTVGSMLKGVNRQTAQISVVSEAPQTFFTQTPFSNLPQRIPQMASPRVQQGSTRTHSPQEQPIDLSGFQRVAQQFVRRVVLSRSPGRAQSFSPMVQGSVSSVHAQDWRTLDTSYLQDLGQIHSKETNLASTEKGMSVSGGSGDKSLTAYRNIFSSFQAEDLGDDDAEPDGDGESQDGDRDSQEGDGDEERPSKKRHRRSERKEKTEAELIAERTCTYCDIIFETKKEMKQHVRFVHGSFPCSECSESFIRQESLTRHVLKHHKGPVNLQCPHCPESFKMQSKFEEHCRGVHSERKPYHCHVQGCHYKTSRLKSLNCHTENVHAEERNFVCEKCGDRFPSKQYLFNHERNCVHTGQHLCQECGAVFNVAQALKHHIRVKHLGEVPYACKVCTKKFADHRNLARHMRIHNNEYPYSCGSCNQRFRHSNTMKYHLEKVHKPGPRATCLQQPPFESPPVCSYCKESWNCRCQLLP